MTWATRAKRVQVRSGIAGLHKNTDVFLQFGTILL